MGKTTSRAQIIWKFIFGDKYAFAENIVPLILGILEYMVRILSEKNIANFIGPSLAAVGLSFTIASLRPKILNISNGSKAVIREKQLIGFIYGFFTPMLAAWFLSAYLAINEIGQEILSFSVGSIIGSVGYLCGFCISAYKRVI